MKGVITVKKLISVILALVLLSACCVSLAEGAAETTRRYNALKAETEDLYEQYDALESIM